MHEQIETLIRQAEEKLAPAFKRLEAIEESGTRRVLMAFQEHQVAYRHFAPTTGYGYDDVGRDTLEKIFADLFGTEAAIVRPHIASGTHAISLCLFGLTLPGDHILSATGKPYDTLEEIIGMGDGPAPVGSLREMGVDYSDVPLAADGTIDLAAVEAAIRPNTKLVIAQRSRGYAWRPSLMPEAFAPLAEMLHSKYPHIRLMVDNCYGEFTRKIEPTDVDVDVIAGSLIKNPGGGIAPTGGYIAGRADLVELCAFRLTTPGTGKEVGASLNQLRGMYLGIFHAPEAVCAALKTAAFAAALAELLGFEAFPKYGEKRTDIIEALKLGGEKQLIAFCQGIQAGSPVDSFASPEPWDMPGYDSQVIMAAGAFTMGASIELSADAPLREPFAVWLQGGLTFPTGKAGIMHAAQYMLDKGLAHI